jgi:hypothetical protein
MAAGDGEGIPTCLAKQVMRPIRNREATPSRADLS